VGGVRVKRLDYRIGRFERIAGFALQSTVPVGLRRSLVVLSLTATIALAAGIVQEYGTYLVL